eukprot:GGOE01024984.1.p2 GENE.GGOE01024984.1~~GGOE01024984.1.p2  ORF type:complete len:247 (-),score=1.85 GGOE01024984.1:368-1084(-)
MSGLQCPSSPPPLNDPDLASMLQCLQPAGCFPTTVPLAPRAPGVPWTALGSPAAIPGHPLPIEPRAPSSAPSSSSVGDMMLPWSDFALHDSVPHLASVFSPIDSASPNPLLPFRTPLLPAFVPTLPLSMPVAGIPSPWPGQPPAPCSPAPPLASLAPDVTATWMAPWSSLPPTQVPSRAFGQSPSGPRGPITRELWPAKSAAQVPPERLNPNALGGMLPNSTLASSPSPDLATTPRSE